ESVEAMALPPAASISFTTSCAGPWSPPEPSSAAPTSATTTLAPSLAISIAMARPMPRPPPVTIATLPETTPVMLSAPCHARAAGFPMLAGLKQGASRRVYRRLRRPSPAIVQSETRLTPYLAGEVDDHAELRPLLLLGKKVALLGRGKAALR